MSVCLVTIVLIFLSTLSLRRATEHGLTIGELIEFLSTLSLRRATAYYICKWLDGEISIHALLTESDSIVCYGLPRDSQFLSTLSLRRATKPTVYKWWSVGISIHALLTESD